MELRYRRLLLVLRVSRQLRRRLPGLDLVRHPARRRRRRRLSVTGREEGEGEEGREGRGEGGGINKSRRTSFCPRYDVTFCASVHRHRRRTDVLRQDAIHLSATGTRRRYG